MNNDGRFWKSIRKLFVLQIIILILKLVFHVSIIDTVKSIISVIAEIISFTIRHPFISLGIALFIVFAPNDTERKHTEDSSSGDKVDFSTPADRYYKKHGFDIYYYTGLPRDKEFNERDLEGYAMNKRFEESRDIEDEDEDSW